MSDSLSNKELVAVGHQFAKAMSSDTPIIDMAKIVSRLAERLDCATLALREATKQRDALAAENAGLKDAAEFATAPDMWEDLGGNVMRYQYQEWYADKLKYAMKTPATDVHLAEVRASTLEDLAKKKRAKMMSLHPDTFALGSVIAALDMQANELEDLATQLRQEAAQ